MGYSLKEKREEQEKYFGDLVFEVWMNGGNPDLVDRDQANDFLDEGTGIEEAARLLTKKDKH